MDSHSTTTKTFDKVKGFARRELITVSNASTVKSDNSELWSHWFVAGSVI